MGQFWPPAGVAHSPTRRLFAAGELMIFNPYFAVALTAGNQYVPGLKAMPPMRSTPVVRREDGTTGLHAFNYLSTSAGSTITRQIALTATSMSNVNALYDAANNGASNLTAGYMLGYNVNPVWLDAT